MTAFLFIEYIIFTLLRIRSKKNQKREVINMLSKTSIVIMGILTKVEKNAYDILKMIDRMLHIIEMEKETLKNLYT